MVKERHAEAHNSQKGRIIVEILSQSFGEYQTNCYICKFPQGEIVIDAGIGATQWVIENCPNPLAFLNTHGHFDHIWSNAELKAHFVNVPLVCPELDVFMLESDCFDTGVSPSIPDILTECKKDSQKLQFNNVEVLFSHFPGHTPGCSIIEIENEIFSGDFIFYRSIGRYDFPYSNAIDMKDSLTRFSQLSCTQNKTIYPGHGTTTTLTDEQHNAKLWIKHIECDL